VEFCGLQLRRCGLLNPNAKVANEKSQWLLPFHTPSLH